MGVKNVGVKINLGHRFVGTQISGSQKCWGSNLLWVPKQNGMRALLERTPIWRTLYFVNEIETFLGVPGVYYLFRGTVPTAYY